MTDAKQRTFTSGAELAKAKNVPLPRKEQDGLCDICGKERAVSIGDACIEAMIETRIETMLEQGKLDPYIEKILERMGRSERRG
jgi:hypothetical protein